MLNKIFLKIFGVLDLVKDFLIKWGLKIAIVIFFLIIAHNVIKMSEISSRYTGEYKNLTPVYEEEKKFINLYYVGEGDKTIVILPEFGAQSPVIQYKTLIDGLKNDYRVVVVEYFGYGYSMSMKAHERTCDNIIDEVKAALEYREIYGPYVLIASDTSNVYAMRFQEKYPENVQGIVSVNGVYPKEVEDTYRLQQVRDRVANININSIFELTGFERIASYLTPDMFYIDKMKAMTDIYTDEEISVYRNRIGSSYLSRTMVREINKLEDNMNQMKNYKYPDYVPVLEVLSSEKKDIYDYAKNSKESKVNLNDLANGVISNSSIQKVEVVEGDEQMLQLSNPTKLLLSIRNFLMTF